LESGIHSTECISSCADLEALSYLFEGLNFSVYQRRWRNQYDPIVLKLDAADQVSIYVVLNR
jgi:hypothetical protein